MALETLTVHRVADLVYRILKERILRLDFTPGQRLQVDRLARQLGVSRTPVKDALNALAGEGLVEIVPRRGTFVAAPSAQTIAELFDLRRALELLAAELLLARVTETDLARLRARLAALDELLDEHADVDEHMRRNLAFHRELVQLAGNRKLLEVYEGLNVHIQIARVHARQRNWRERRHQEREEHYAILAALEARDPHRLAAAVDGHIRRAKDSLIQDLTTAGDVASACAGNTAPPRFHEGG